MPAGNPYTFEMNWNYDSWNRLLNITYPDGEQVNYLYNNGGLLKSVKGYKLGQQTDYINTIEYDKFEKRIRMQYANETYCNYVYNPVTLRLDNLSSFNSAGEKMQEISYTYDNVSNITQIQNTASQTGNGMGGGYIYSFGYDDLYRLMNAEGGWEPHNTFYRLTMGYSPSGNITNKQLYAETMIDGAIQTIDYTNIYSYNTRPHVLSEINQGEITTNWDANGNLLTYRNDRLPLIRNHCWDEENRLSAVTDFQTAAAYLYDGSDERVWKLTGNVQQMTINGQYTLNFTELNNHTLYTSPYMVVNDQGYTKHYYIEGERICSKLGGGFGGVSYHIDEPLDFINDTWDNTAGLDADKILRDLECTGLGDGFSVINSSFEIINHIRDASDPEEDYYFYHSDHLGSTSFITDANGEVQQHLQYLPFGELLLEQREHMSRYTPYQFSAKEKDEETGYSYFGARYYMPELSIWLSVDPMSDETPGWGPYHYCHNNPIRLIDPDGKSADEWDFNLATGDVTWVSNKGGASTQHVNVIGPNGSSIQNALPGNGFNVSSFIPNENVTLTSNGFSNDYQYTASSLLPGNISSTIPEVTPTGQSASAPSQPKATTDAAAPWMSYALKEVGVTEFNPGSNPRVETYLSSAGLPNVTDATPWCAAFVHWSLGQAGIKGAGATGRNYSNWGTHLNKPQYGAVAIFRTGHVGFFVGQTKSKYTILHGNWSDQVMKSKINPSQIKEFRFPKKY